MNRTRDCVRLWGTLGTMLVAAAAALALAALDACGGGGETDPHDLATNDAPPPVRQAPHDFSQESEYGPGEAPGPRTAPADEPGSPKASLKQPSPHARPAGEPVDQAARTLYARYIGRAAAEDTDRITEGEVIWLDADCCQPGGAASAEGIVFGLQAVVGDEAPIFVFGRDLRHAARVADRLHTLGLRHVHLVTP